MKQIAAALVKAQKAFGPALKTHTNPAFRTKYADLSACVEAVIDALNNNGIALIQKTHRDDSGVTVETVFVHESGEEISSGVLHVPASKQDPQGYGSALTYARRYSLMAACGIAPEDDDGNAASKHPPAKQKTEQQDRTEAPAAFDIAKALQWIGSGNGLEQQKHRGRTMYGKATTEEDRARIKNYVEELEQAALASV